MRKRLQHALISACFGALFSSLALGQGIGERNRASDSSGGNFSLKGWIVLPDGRPAQNARVNVSSTDQPAKYYYTGMDGTFQTGSIPAGNYTISASVAGLPTESERLTIDRDTPSRTFNVTLYLRDPGQKKGDSYSSDPNFRDVPKTAFERFRKGMEKLEKNNAKEAILDFDAAIAAHPNFPIAYYEKGAAHLKANELDAALAAFVRAIELKPDYTGAKYSVGYVQYLRKNYEVAAAIFDDVVKVKPDMSEAEIYRGISLYHLNYIDAAEVSLKKSIGTSSGARLPIAHLYLGQIYITKKKNAEAAAELEKYLELVPTAPNAEKLKTTIVDLRKKT